MQLDIQILNLHLKNVYQIMSKLQLTRMPSNLRDDYPQNEHFDPTTLLVIYGKHS